MRLFGFVTVCALLTASCGSMVGVDGAGGGSLASVAVEHATIPAIRSATLAVFREQGFSRIAETGDSLEFQKAGGRGAEMAWKTIGNSNPVWIRPTVRWRAEGGGRVRVMCDVEVVQESTAFGDTVREPLVAGKAAYHRMLGEVKRRVESAAR